MAAGERRVSSNKPRIAAHQLHKTDTVARGDRLGICGVDGSPRLAHRRFESKRLVHEGHVVVDRLGDAHNAELDALAHGFFANRLGAAKRAVTANREQDPDAERG